MNYSDSLLADISNISAPEGWSSMVCGAERGLLKYLQLDYPPGNAHITVKLDVAQTYATICGLNNTEIRSSSAILELFSSGAYVDTSDRPKYNGLNTCMFYSGFGKADSPESGSAFSILMAHHDDMIAEIRLVVTPAIDKPASCLAKEWLHTNAIQKYLDDVSKCLAASGE
ncbi:hypothetical protein [Xiamenia xianingshaonis]|uniref:Uncharacterized protein n=1 Tax=Xiamenia xianingshaonis TaxID=2682776 RepID=A0A9E6MSC4_9ACTN|nr:hypothetical protein [Xiamenia xianingshaonis]NHM13732.1 hypothetical protein [Xiamenia xianingshaonis]QTU85100.1 hypothetical protein J7S26_04125 [Xiamenia xianingshaonis]